MSKTINDLIMWNKEEFSNFDTDVISDGYHTFGELYQFRLMYNAALFNEWAINGKHDVHKSKRHYDGEKCFGRDDFFIVAAMLPSGQITNHYNMEHWDLFNIPEEVTAKFKFDGHSPADVLTRLKSKIME